jgi:hypothetical protein
MRIFDVYEHPSFEAEKDKATVQTTIRRLGVGATVGATVSALAAISFWGYYWSNSSPQSAVFANAHHSIAHQIR